MVRMEHVAAPVSGGRFQGHQRYNSIMYEAWLTTQEASELSGYHKEYIRKLLQQDRIAGQKFGPVWQVNRVSLLKYVARMEEKGKRRGPKPEK